MKTYTLQWSPTEGRDYPLSYIGSPATPVYQQEFFSVEEAKEAYEKELKATDLTPISELDFSPTDMEVRRNCTSLDIVVIETDEYTDEEEMGEVIKSSDYFWIE